MTPEDKKSLQSTINTVNTYDYALFISPTAVIQTAKLISLSSLKLTIGAIGEATSAALEKAGLNVQLTPGGNKSESLLQHPLLNAAAIKNKRIIIFKGEGGRDLLTNTLSSRGASVFNANVYKRNIPTNFTPLTNLTLQNIDAVLVSSGEGLHNLLTMVVEKSTLMGLTTIVPGERCATIAKELGFKSIVVAANATNNAFIDALEHLDK